VEILWTASTKSQKKLEHYFRPLLYIEISQHGTVYSQNASKLNTRTSQMKPLCYTCPRGVKTNTFFPLFHDTVWTLIIHYYINHLLYLKKVVYNKKIKISEVKFQYLSKIRTFTKDLTRKMLVKNKTYLPK